MDACSIQVTPTVLPPSHNNKQTADNAKDGEDEKGVIYP